MNTLISRSEAKAQGLTTYFTGKPCKRGHIAPRHVNGGCKECDVLKKREWRKANPEESSRRVMEYQTKNRVKYQARKLATHNQRRNTDLALNLKLRLRRRMNGAMHAVGSKAVDSTLALLGCTPDDLKAHLAAQFTDGMTLDNYGEWEIDHIRPCASFDLTDPDQQRACFHYTNLQPLWRSDNRSKGAKLVA